MPFARIDLAKGKSAEYRSTIVNVVYSGLVEVLKVSIQISESWDRDRSVLQRAVSLKVIRRCPQTFKQVF